MASAHLSEDARVIVVVVAWNRSELLRKCLDGLAAQTRPPDAVVVVDNASTDTTPNIAASHRVVSDLVRLPRNTGGAGGFAAGIARAVAGYGADWVWVMDDDTVPTPDALAHLLGAATQPGRPVTLVASRADWHDGREHPMNTPRTRVGVSPHARAAAQAAGARPIRSASFVSIMVASDAIRRHGLPVADYFLWNDDFEFTARLLRHGVGWYVPASRVVHLTKTFGDAQADPGSRFYNEVRNKVWLFTRSRALAPWEKVLYGVSTARRWLRTIAGASDRRATLRHARRGLADGLRHGPRPTTRVLADTVVAAEVEAIQRGARRAV